jgi:hypothetical protein
MHLLAIVPRKEIYVLKPSSNLVNWISFGGTAITPGAFEFIDDAAAELDRRFYRIKARS